MKHPWRALAALGGGMALLLITGLLTPTSATAATTARSVTTAPAGDGPPGFWWGTDSFPVTVPGSAPYQMPYLGGAYGGYIGMTGNWAYWQGCKGGFIALSTTNDAQAHTNYVTYHAGVGSGAYWFMGGPGVDPHYNGTTTEAAAWGAAQAARALADIADGAFDYKVVWMDIELPGIAPAPDNGWNNVYTSACSGVVKQSYVPTSLDRADFNGFWDYITAHSAVQGRRLLLGRGLGVDLRHRQRLADPAHLRVDLRAGDHQLLRRLPVRLVPGSRRRALRAVLRRSDQRQPVRADVAVVRRRRSHQRHRRLQRRPRHDRLEQAELNCARSLAAMPWHSSVPGHPGRWLTWAP